MKEDKLPFCGLVMECKTTSVGADVSEFESFMREHINKPFTVEVQLSGALECFREVPRFYGFIKIDYLFNLVQANEPQPEKEVPPMGADW